MGVEASSRGDAGVRGWLGVQELWTEQASGVVGRPTAPPHRGSNVPLPAICCRRGSDPDSPWRGPQCGPQKLGLGLSPHSDHPPRRKAEIWGPGATPGPSGLGWRWGRPPRLPHTEMLRPWVVHSWQSLALCYARDEGGPPRPQPGGREHSSPGRPRPLAPAPRLLSHRNLVAVGRARSVRLALTPFLTHLCF